MGYDYYLRPVTAAFVKEIEDLTPEALAAYMKPRLPAAIRDREARNPFLSYLFSPSVLYLGGDVAWDIPASGKPLFNCMETQAAMALAMPYVIDHKGMERLREQYDRWQKEDSVVWNVRRCRRRLRWLRSVERRYLLAVIFAG